MMFWIGTVLLIVRFMMDTISGAQSETNELLRELVEASRQRRHVVQEDPTGSKAKAQAAEQAEPAAETQAEAQTAKAEALIHLDLFSDHVRSMSLWPWP